MFFKRLSLQLAGPLSVLYNNCMSVGVAKYMEAYAIITPIYKGGIASEVGNYRPVSLTSVAL